MSIILNVYLIYWYFQQNQFLSSDKETQKMMEEFLQEQNRLIYEKEGLQREIQDLRCKLNMAPHHHGRAE
jgi:hypothetical protein